MMKNRPLQLLSIAFVLLLTASCEEAGPGGTSTITGKVFVQDYSTSGNLLGEFYGPEERVYIIYGDGSAFDDDTRTSLDGSYKFEYLNKGSYRVFCYSNCDTCASGTRAVIKDLEITSSNSTVEVEDMIVRR
ncbi:MAG: hypothetical protein K9J06_01625 [Flavobacteriales bacterium]|nr:hypothetical protein [Flavobacteriales bacterium]